MRPTTSAHRGAATAVIVFALLWAARAAAQSSLSAAPAEDIHGTIALSIRVGLAAVAFLSVLQLLRGVFLMLTHGGNEESKAEAVGVMVRAAVMIVAFAVSGALARTAVAAAADAGMKIIRGYLFF